MHESSGTQWFSREYHAQLVWWRTLPELLAATDSPAAARAAALADAERWAAAQHTRAEASRWHYDALAAETAAVLNNARPRKPGLSA